MSDVTLLRTMARKSVFNFGQHEGRTVQQLIDLKHFRILRWYYYNCSKVSFLPDILEEIGITEEWRIDKPGKDPDKGLKLDAIKDAKEAAFRKIAYENREEAAMGETMKKKAHARRKSKSMFVGFMKQDARQFAKGTMAWKNQGHK